MDAEKWGEHVHLDPSYQQRARQRRQINHVRQAYREHADENRGTHLPPAGMKERVFQYIFGENWSSQK